MSNKYILVDGKPVAEPDLLKWGRWMGQSNKERIVQQDWIGKVHVSTVFLGFDHCFGDVGPPLLYETMIFGGPLGGYQERYSTVEDAWIGHTEALKKARESIDNG